MDHDASGEARTAAGHASRPSASLIDGLAQAMRDALTRERERIDQMVETDAREHTDRARARAEREAAELRRLADDEIREIEAWAAQEIKRIRREAARRTKERRADMASFLRRHDSIIETEIAGLEAAASDYSETLRRFVENLSATGDPGEIARRADSVPTPPDMDEIRAAARATAVAAHDQPDDGPMAEETGAIDVEPATPEASEPASDPGVAVMDPDADGRPADLPLAVDPLHIPEDEAVAAAEPTTQDEDATEANGEANGEPSGALRFFRALVPWSAAPNAPHAKDTEARSS